MGTRNLTIAVVDKEIKVAQYGQWDGYPEGQGFKILDFYRKLDNLGLKNLFREALRNTTFLSNEEFERIMDEFGNDYEKEKEWFAENPQFSRDTGSKILDLILESQGKIQLRNAINFATDSLFCEWAYLIDMDSEELEVYRGFNLTQLEEDQRFYGWEIKYPGDNYDQKYYPIKMVQKYSLDNLPDNDTFAHDLREPIYL